MRILQINSIYKKYSTGRTSQELHEAFLRLGIESYIASPMLYDLNDNCYSIGTQFDHKIHAFLSRLTGKQAYFSNRATKNLLSYIKKINPDIILLRNLHSNYINFPILMEFIAANSIATIIVLHDCWFFTGKCVYYSKYGCKRWMQHCGSCPGLHDGNNSYFFDRSSLMLQDKQELFSKLNRLAVVGVSQWITEDAKKSILAKANIIKCVYNWIDLNVFNPLAQGHFKKKYGLKGKKVILGVAAFWDENKGVSVFSDISKKIDQCYKVVLVGECKIDCPEILFLGKIEDPKILAAIYADADVFINPSIQETFGKTTAEAMSCGTPVIAFNSTATPELLGKNGECGYLLDSNDPEEYLNCIKEVESRHLSMSINCRKRAECLFSMRENIQEYVRICEDLISMK